jgi:hypothetical protein
VKIGGICIAYHGAGGSGRMIGWLAGGEGLVGLGIGIDGGAVADSIQSDESISESSMLGDGRERGTGGRA